MDSPHSEFNSPRKEQETLFCDTQSGSDFEPSLRAIAAPAREKKRMSPELMRELIRRLCRGRFLSVQEMARLLRRGPKSLQERYLTPMCREGLLALRYPGKPNRPDQAYTSKGPPDVVRRCSLVYPQACRTRNPHPAVRPSV